MTNPIPINVQTKYDHTQNEGMKGDSALQSRRPSLDALWGSFRYVSSLPGRVMVDMGAPQKSPLQVSPSTSWNSSQLLRQASLSGTETDPKYNWTRKHRSMSESSASGRGWPSVEAFLGD